MSDEVRHAHERTLRLMASAATWPMVRPESPEMGKAVNEAIEEILGQGEE